MTATQTLVLRCNVDRCREVIVASPRESLAELRRRSMREQGWRYSVTRGRESDLCRWHA